MSDAGLTCYQLLGHADKLFVDQVDNYMTHVSEIPRVSGEIQYCTATVVPALRAGGWTHKVIQRRLIRQTVSTKIHATIDKTSEGCARRELGRGRLGTFAKPCRAPLLPPGVRLASPYHQLANIATELPTPVHSLTFDDRPLQQ